MKVNLYLIIGGILILTSCSAKLTSSIQKTYAPLDYKEEVRIFELGEEIPPNAEKLGTIKIGDSGFSTNCNYDVVIEKAMLASRKVGGNALKITEHYTPDILSSCHRIIADVLRIADIENFKAVDEIVDIDNVLFDADYAIINVYRAGGQGALVSYDLYLGDSIICRVSKNFCESIKIYKEGLNSLWAKTESKTEIPINVEFGKTYYVRCGITMGAFVGRPSLTMVDNNTGKAEFNAIELKNNKKNK
ncbi:MAG: DUF2846 domain-containing protein [Marinilabiliaceae bacterium]|nr:DUF2846 domain-containing protein [Marinilabiliaceae bacterium]